VIPEALVLSFIVALIRGGSVSRLAATPLRRTWLIIAPGLLLILLYLAKPLGVPHAAVAARHFQLVAYAFILAALCWNLRLPGIAFVASGTGLNFLVTLLNRGDMPVSLPAARAAGMHELARMLVSNKDLVRHVLMSDHTRLNFLADIIPAPRPPFPFPGVMSVGDIMASIGLFVFVQYAMVGGRSRRVES